MSKGVSKVTAASINEAHRLAKECAETAVQHAIRCGQLLALKKKELPHGDFQQWIERNCEFAYSTAARYMKAGQNSTAVEISTLSSLFPSGKQATPKPTPRKEEVAPPVVEKPAERVEIVATFPAVPASEPEPEDDWSPEELANAEAAEAEYARSMDKVMQADDRLAAAHAEIKRQAAEIASLKLARDGFMNGKAAITKLLGQEQRKVERLEKKLKAADNELEALRERVAIMEASA